MTVDVQVRRKIRDLVRDAAEDALRVRWPSLTRVDRAEVWTFAVAPGGEEDVTRVLEETTLVANPNIHRWTRDGGAPAPAADGGARVRVTVRDRVDPKGASVLRSVRERLGLRGIEGVSRSVQWTLELPASREEAEGLAREVAGRDGRGAGLLANPHAQDVETRVTAS